MATVNKNFRIKQGLVVEGSTGTIGGQNILTETGGDQYILNLIGGETLVKSVDTNVFNVDGSGNLTIISNTFDSYGSASSAQSAAAQDATTKANAAQAAAEATAALDATTKANAAEAAAALDATSKANQALADAQTYANSLASNYDSVGSAADALDDANAYTDSALESYTPTASLDTTIDGYGYLKSDDISGKQDTLTSGSNIAIVNNIISVTGLTSSEISDFNSAALSATSSAYDTAGTAAALIDDSSTDGTHVWSSYKTSSEIGVAVSNLVDSAPALLDTLNELAAAIADNPNYATDMAANLAAKQNTLTAGSNINISNDTISVTGLASTDISDFSSAALSATSAAYDAAGDAAAAQAAAETFATNAINDLNTGDIEEGSNLYFTNQRALDATSAAYDAAGDAAAAQAAAEATAQAALDDVLDSTTPFESMNINDVAKQVAARVTSLGSVVVTAYEFNKTNFKSGKFLVKIDNGTHNEISEILVTLDSSDNVAITEYAIVGTNGSRGTITADVSGTHCRIRVNPTNDSTITVSGTVFNA